MQPCGGNIIGKDKGIKGIKEIIAIKCKSNPGSYFISIKPENNTKNGSMKTKQNLTKTMVVAQL